jgi:hypothetical protein
MKCKWQQMPWQEAYPASDGYTCLTCNKYQLAWFGLQIKPEELKCLAEDDVFETQTR